MLNLILSIMLLVLPSSPNDKTEIINHTSFAYDSETDEVLYKEVTEKIYKEEKIQQVKSEYISPEGELISKRIMKFGDDSTKSSYKLEDLRSGYVEGAEVINTGVVRVFTRESFDSILE